MDEELYEKRKLQLKYVIQTFEIIGISQYILNQENVRESFEISVNNGYDHNGDEYYDDVVLENELLRKDEEIINMVYSKVLGIKYDKENSEECAKAVYAVAAFLSTNIARTEHTWNKVRQKIIEILRQMSSRDFITTLEIAGVKEVCDLQEIRGAIKEKIPQMTECEFLRIYTDFVANEIEMDSELEELISKRVEISSNVLAPKYIALSDNPEDVEMLMDNVQETESIEAIIEALKFIDEGINIKIVEKIKNLSDEQLVRLVVRTADFGYENNEVDELLISRMKKLHMEEIEVILAVYIRSTRINMKKEIIKIALEKGVLYEDENDKSIVHTKRPILQDEKIKQRVSVYQNTNSPITDLATMMCEDDLDNAIRLYNYFENATEDEIHGIEQQIDEDTLGKYESINESIEITEEMIEYVKQLAEMDDKSIVKIIAIFKGKLKQINGKTEETPLNIIRVNSYNLLEKYLYNRILEMKDKGAIILLSTLFTTDNPYFNAAIQVKLEECEDQIKLVIPSGEGR